MMIVDCTKLKEVLTVPECLDVALLVSIGYPAEHPIVEQLADGRINYWLDNDGVLNVRTVTIKCIVN